MREKKIKPKDALIFGRNYSLWKDGVFLNVGVWTDDVHNGEVFITKHESGAMLVTHIEQLDSWIMEVVPNDIWNEEKTNKIKQFITDQNKLKKE